MPQEVDALPQGSAAGVQVGFESPVLDLDADGALIADVRQDRKEPAPRHVAQTRQLGPMVFQRRRQDPDVVQAVTFDLGVLGMHMKDAVAELVQRLDAIDLLPDQVRGIVVQAETGAGNVVKHPPPDSGAVGQILPARPFVPREQHRAVLDGDANGVRFGQLDQRPPDFQKPGPIVVDGSRPVAADERVHDADAQQPRGGDHLLEVLQAHPGFGLVGGQQVRIIAQVR